MHNIWIADDDEAIRLILEESLSSSGFKTKSFSSADGLIKSLDKNKSLVIDDTPEKQNKMFPGKHIAVKSWENTEFNDFDIAVVLSWNYVDYLEKKNKTVGKTMKNYIKNLQKEEHYQSDFSKWSKSTKKDNKK